MADERTPLPVRQLALLLFLRFCESASAFVIFPFLNELLASVTGDAAKVGYYAGVMESIRQLVSLLVVMNWSRLSDHIGRKPILLLGTLALSISTVSFGLSKTFVGLVTSRCIFVALNSNAGVIKGTVGEITDHTNSADAFALLHIPWAVGSSFGALIGGWLARPHDHFPGVFGGKIWEIYPYFLPCAVMGFLSMVAFTVVYLYMTETVKGGYFYNTKSSSDESSEPLLRSSHPPGHTRQYPHNENPVPLGDLLNWRILVPVANYVCLSSLHSTFNALQPLFLAMPIDIGGLELPPRKVGYILGSYGFVSSIFQTVLLGRLVHRFGIKRVFFVAVAGLIPMFSLPPVMNLLVKGGGFSSVLWIALGVQLFSSLVMELGYGCIYMYITTASPNKRSLGAVNGLAQTLVSIGRIITPGLANGLLSYSIEHHILHGYASYLTMGILAVGGVWLASILPHQLDEYENS